MVARALTPNCSISKISEISKNDLSIFFTIKIKDKWIQILTYANNLKIGLSSAMNLWQATTNWWRSHGTLRTLYLLFLGQVVSFVLALMSFTSSLIATLGNFNQNPPTHFKFLGFFFFLINFLLLHSLFFFVGFLNLLIENEFMVGGFVQVWMRLLHRLCLLTWVWL